MVDAAHLLPPAAGPRSDPLLFGVAEALARLFPVEACPMPAALPVAATALAALEQDNAPAGTRRAEALAA